MFHKGCWQICNFTVWVITLHKNSVFCLEYYLYNWNICEQAKNIRSFWAESHRWKNPLGRIMRRQVKCCVALGSTSCLIFIILHLRHRTSPAPAILVLLFIFFPSTQMSWLALCSDCRYNSLMYTDIMHVFLCQEFDDLVFSICWQILFSKLGVEKRIIHFCIFVLLGY
jgi:hypothetical protein